METKTDAMCTRLIIQAELARHAKNGKERSEALARLSQTLFNIARPKFDKEKLTKAFRESCVEGPDYGSPVALEGKIMHANGSFDLDVLSHLYFIEAPATIEGEFDVNRS